MDALGVAGGDGVLNPIPDPREGGHIARDRAGVVGCRVDEKLPSPGIEAGQVDLDQGPRDQPFTALDRPFLGT